MRVLFTFLLFSLSFLSVSAQKDPSYTMDSVYTVTYPDGMEQIYIDVTFHKVNNSSDTIKSYEWKYDHGMFYHNYRLFKISDKDTIDIQDVNVKGDTTYHWNGGPASHSTTSYRNPLVKKNFDFPILPNQEYSYTAKFFNVQYLTPGEYIIGFRHEDDVLHYSANTITVDTLIDPRDYLKKYYIGQYDDKNNKTGEWSYYKYGKLLARGDYDYPDSIQENKTVKLGRWEFYDEETGEVRRVKDYDGSKDYYHPEMSYLLIDSLHIIDSFDCKELEHPFACYNEIYVSISIYEYNDSPESERHYEMDGCDFIYNFHVKQTVNSDTVDLNEPLFYGDTTFITNASHSIDCSSWYMYSAYGAPEILPFEFSVDNGNVWSFNYLKKGEYIVAYNPDSFNDSINLIYSSNSIVVDKDIDPSEFLSWFSIGKYEDGYRIGKWKRYKSGEKYSKGTYSIPLIKNEDFKESIKTGKWKYYDIKTGELSSIEFYDQQGDLIKEIIK